MTEKKNTNDNAKTPICGNPPRALGSPDLWAIPAGIVVAQYLALGGLVGGLIYEFTRPYYDEVKQLSSKVKSKYDSNNNGVIDSKEGSKLLRDLGYVPPQNNFTLEFKGGSREKKYVNVRVHGANHRNCHNYRVPISRLRGLTQKTRKR